MLLDALEKAPIRDRIVLQAVRSRRQIPPRLLEPPPELPKALELYMRCFWELCCDRYQPGARIPWSAVQKWVEAMGIDRADREDFHFLVSRLDVAYLKWQDKRKPTEPPAKPKEKFIDPRRLR